MPVEGNFSFLFSRFELSFLKFFIIEWPIISDFIRQTNMQNSFFFQFLNLNLSF